MDDENPDLDLDWTIWAPMPSIPADLPMDMQIKLAGLMEDAKRKQVDEKLEAAKSAKPDGG